MAFAGLCHYRVVARLQTLSVALARRIALAAQGFANPRPSGRIDVRHVRRVLDQVGLVQIDSVNVLCRSHYLPLFSRLGAYPSELLDNLAWSQARRELFEYWGHEASLLPLRLQPFVRWRMARAQDNAWRRVARIARERPDFVEHIYAQVVTQGPLRAGATAPARRAAGPRAMWDWHDGKVALEWLFYQGRISAATRRNFERLYDLTERVIPPTVLDLPTPTEADAQRELVRVSAAALGVATESDIRDYFRLGVADCRARISELVESGELEIVSVSGWRGPAYLWHGAKMPRRIATRALLSPFDSLIWERARTQRLFDFTYRLEIYVPQDKRVHGYYVLPFLLGDRLAARVDLKADRRAGVLMVRAAYCEDGWSPDEVAGELSAELTDMAKWLGLSGVWASGPGNMSTSLAIALARQ